MPIVSQNDYFVNRKAAGKRFRSDIFLPYLKRKRKIKEKIGKMCMKVKPSEKKFSYGPVFILLNLHSLLECATIMPWMVGSVSGCVTK